MHAHVYIYVYIHTCIYTYTYHTDQTVEHSPYERLLKTAILATILPFIYYYFWLLAPAKLLVLPNLKIHKNETIQNVLFGACLLSLYIVYKIDPCYFCGCSSFFFIVA